MDSDVLIRPAQAADARGIADVHVAAWRWAYDGLIPAEYLAALDPARREASWTATIEDPAHHAPLVAVRADTIIGFVHHGPSRDADAGCAVGEVTAIYLAPEAVGGGVGHALWTAALDALKASGHRSVTVWLLVTNDRGRHFYERVGLRPDGATKAESRGDLVLDEVRYRGPVD